MVVVEKAVVPLPHPSACQGCSFNDKGLGFIPPDSLGGKLVTWGEAGGADEEREGRGFVGRSGKLLRRAMRAAGLDVWSGSYPYTPEEQEQALFTNTVLCRPPGNRFPGYGVAQECLKRHQSQTTLAEYGVPWLSLGANATEGLTSWKLKILDVRGSILPARDNHWVTCSVHPAFLLRGGNKATEKGKVELYPFLVHDIHRAYTTKAPRIPSIHMVDDPLDIGEVWAKAGKLPVSVDIEGKNGHPHIVGVTWHPDHAWVCKWDENYKLLLSEIFRETTDAVLHNASYDVPELEEAGVPPPDQWDDTINLAAAYNQQSGMMNLQAQVLTYVPGSCAWKGLVDHQGGYKSRKKDVMLWEEIWTELLTRLGRQVPADRWQWYHFYNGLDVAWTFALRDQLRARLEAQGRADYYYKLMKPLQAPLLAMGQRGMPADAKRLAYHREACLRLESMARKILRDAGGEMLKDRIEDLKRQVRSMEQCRSAERAIGARKFSRAKELTSLRTKLKTREKNLEEGFNFDSAPQRCALLYEWFMFPVVKDRGTKNPTSNDKAIDSLVSRLERGTIKAKRDPDKARRALFALRASKKWATHRRSFLEPPLKVSQ